MNKNGCHNRAPLRTTALVQSGWREIDDGLNNFLVSNMVAITDPMSKACIYQRDKKDDKKCQGCKELKP